MLTEEERETIRKRLRYYVTVHRLSLTELSHQLDGHKSLAGKILRGDVQPDRYWGAFCRVLGIPVLRIISWSDEEFETFLTERLMGRV